MNVNIQIMRSDEWVIVSVNGVVKSSHYLESYHDEMPDEIHTAINAALMGAQMTGDLNDE